jgi:hypothetical protein
MKNQYFGDINDYRKYGLLRVLTRVSGLKVGMCWLLTEDDHTCDGQFRDYLNRPDRWRSYDPELYDTLQLLQRSETTPSVAKAREWAIIPNASCFETLLSDTLLAREEYFQAAYQSLQECPLIFMDPDNGIEVESTRLGARGSAKYIYWREIKEIYSKGHSLLIYQHFPRVQRDRFIPFLADRLADELWATRITAFRTPHVAFFLVQQPHHEVMLKDCPHEVRSKWPGQLMPWP